MTSYSSQQKSSRIKRASIFLIGIPSAMVILVILVGKFIMMPMHVTGLGLFPTFEPDDTVLADKTAYLFSSPSRGEIVLFNHPKVDKLSVSRIIGEPGDRIAIKNKVVYINDASLVQVPISEEQAIPQWHHGFLNSLVRVKERIKEPSYVREHIAESSHFVIFDQSSVGVRDDFVATVPPDHFFVLGDNRDDSDDSRLWGFLPRRNIIGKATTTVRSLLAPILSKFKQARPLQDIQR